MIARVYRFAVGEVAIESRKQGRSSQYVRSAGCDSLPAILTFPHQLLHKRAKVLGDLPTESMEASHLRYFILSHLKVPLTVCGREIYILSGVIFDAHQSRSPAVSVKCLRPIFTNYLLIP